MLRSKSALTVPTASEAATTVKTAEAAMAETSAMGDAHAVRETAAPEMGDMGETDAATFNVAQAAHAVASAMTEAPVVRVATQYRGIAVITAVLITEIIPAQCGAANRRIVDQPGRTGVGLRGSRLRSSERSPRITQCQQPLRSLWSRARCGSSQPPLGFAQQFKLILKWASADRRQWESTTLNVF